MNNNQQLSIGGLLYTVTKVLPRLRWEIKLFNPAKTVTSSLKVDTVFVVEGNHYCVVQAKQGKQTYRIKRLSEEEVARIKEHIKKQKEAKPTEEELKEKMKMRELSLGMKATVPISNPFEMSPEDLKPSL